MVVKEKILLKNLFYESSQAHQEQLGIFALLNLDILESLNNGLLSVSDALQTFFNAENSLFVRKRLQDRVADEIMSRGVQLPDLFEALPPDEAQREFQ
ncbi:MAG: hypothetical protein Fur0022_48920 [Anaerolineales bacterium]